MNIFPIKNTGLIPLPPRVDFVGASLPYEVVLGDGDWRPYLPVGEPQAVPQPNPVLETFACVSFSNNNCAEIQLKQQGVNVNFSDRFLAKLSGTTKQGNNFEAVYGTNLIYGRVMENQWPVLTNYTWDSYYSSIPQSVKSKAIYYDEKREYIATDLQTLKYYLKHTPIQITIPIPVANHAVVLVHIDNNNVLYYYDTYGVPSFLKTMTLRPQAAMRLIIKEKIMTKKFLVNDGGKIGCMVLEGFTGTIAFADSEPHLQMLKDAYGFTGQETTIQIPQ